MNCSFRGHKTIYLIVAEVRICIHMLNLHKIKNTTNILEKILI